MNIARTVALAFALGLASAASAQTPATTPAAPMPAAPMAAPPAASTTAMPAGGGMDKKAISKQCSAMADQQKLHGKARKTFRNSCKMKGGKAA